MWTDSSGGTHPSATDPYDIEGVAHIAYCQECSPHFHLPGPAPRYAPTYANGEHFTIEGSVGVAGPSSYKVKPQPEDPIKWAAEQDGEIPSLLIKLEPRHHIKPLTVAIWAAALMFIVAITFMVL